MALDKDFFNRIGEKISEVGADVSQKAKDASAVLSLKNKIREEENKEKFIYQEIGRKYFEEHKADEEDPYADDIKAILAAKAGIETLRDQLQEIKGIEFCPVCKEEIDKETIFCPKCGNKVR